MKKLSERLESVNIELTDIHNELTRLAEDDNMDPERLQIVSERLNLIYRLQKKHQAADFDRIDEKFEMNWLLKINLLMIWKVKLNSLKKQLQPNTKNSLHLLQKITQDRKKQIPVFEGRINDMLTSVGMKEATVKAVHEILPEHQLTAHGRDENRNFIFLQIEAVVMPNFERWLLAGNCLA